MKPSPIPFRFNYDERYQLWILTTGNLFGRKQYVGKSVAGIRALYNRGRQYRKMKEAAQYETDQRNTSAT